MPYFNHPDPSAKENLVLTFTKGSGNLGSSISTPYFYDLSNSRDLTFKPRIYMDNDFIFHAEYREAFKNSDLVTDFSFNKNEDNSNSHFFASMHGVRR